MTINTLGLGARRIRGAAHGTGMDPIRPILSPPLRRGRGKAPTITREGQLENKREGDNAEGGGDMDGEEAQSSTSAGYILFFNTPDEGKGDICSISDAPGRNLTL